MGHNGCDPDSLSSILLVREIILTHFEKKNIDTVVKEKDWPVFSEYNIPGYNNIRNIEEEQTIDFDSYDLIFLVDISEFGERTADMPQNIENVLKKTVVIDHHLNESKQNPIIYINNELPSASMQIYLSFKELLADNFKLTKNIAHLAQLGLITDTGRFLFASTTPKAYEVMSELTTVYKLDLEKLDFLESNISKSGLKVFIHILSNTKYKNDYSYTFIDPEFIKENNIEQKELEEAYYKYISTILTSTADVKWGFIVKEKDTNLYGVSFRSRDTNIVKHAKKLGGGGHIYAAGCRIKADTINDAVDIIVNSIKK